MLFGHLVFWSIFYLLLLVIVVYIAVPASEMHNFKYILLLTVTPAIFFDSLNMIGNYYFRFTENPKVIAFVGILSGAISLFATYYCIVILEMGYMGWFIASFLASLVLFLCYFYPVFLKLKLYPILRFKKKIISKYLRVSLPMIPHNYSSYLLNSSDRVVMDLMKVNVGQIGLYNVAYKFGNAFEIMGEAVGMAVGPQYVKLFISKTKDSLITARNLTFFLMISFLAMAFLVSLWMNEIFRILIHNKELVVAYDVGIIIFMGYCYRPMYWSAVNKLASFEKTNVLWRISFVAGILNVILNLIFVNQFGIYAAAINTFISLMFVGFSGFYVTAYKKLEGVDHYPLLWLVLIIGLTVTVYLLRDVNILMKIIISFIVILFSLQMLSVLNRKNKIDTLPVPEIQ
jgi:O-antigen/teichoic acid export membrane protein